MRKHPKTYDVFLSYSSSDEVTARQISHKLSQAGLRVFDHSEIHAGENIQNMIWRALAESAAMVVVVRPDADWSSEVALEVGAGLAWNKPMYVFLSGKGRLNLAPNLALSRVYSISDVDAVAKSIMADLRPLSPSEISTLREAYLEARIPTDALATNPLALEKVASIFNRMSGKNLSGERLIRELILLRKKGSLSRIGKP